MKQKRAKSGKGKKVIIAIIVILLIVLVIGVLVVMKFKKQETATENMIWQSQGEANIVQGDMIFAYGVTSIGMSEESFPIQNLENSLEIEEVYISSGESIQEDTALFKVTGESLVAVREELEAELKEADLAYRAGLIEYEQSKITSYYEKENTLLTGKHATAVYEETISGLYENVQRAKEELDETNTRIAEYEAAIAENTYYEDYQVEYYKNLYDENRALLVKKVEEWDVEWSDVTGGGMSSGSMMRAVSGSSASGGDAGGSVSGSDVNPGLYSQYVTVLSSFYKVLEQNEKDYKQALEAYEDAAENAVFELQTLKLQVSELEKKYTEALNSYENNILQAQLTKETTLSKVEKAEGIYEDDMEKAEANYQKLLDAKEEAEENLALLEAHIIDDCYYGSGVGKLLRVNIRAGENISSESRIYTLSNLEEVTVTVSVDQEDIAKLKVGDAAMIQSTESGMYKGLIQAINPVSNSDSKASITYSVTVVLEAGTEGLEANETVIVYFGLENGAKKNEG